MSDYPDRRYCSRCDFYTDHVSTAHDGLAARGLLKEREDCTPPLVSGGVGAEVAAVHPCLDPTCPGATCGPDGAAAPTTLAEVLAAHVLYGEDGDDQFECKCGKKVPPSAMEEGGELEWHHKHVADALAPLIAERVEAAKAEALAPIRALADELQRDIEDRREDTPVDDGSWPIARAEWIGRIAGLSDALAQLRGTLFDAAGGADV